MRGHTLLVVFLLLSFTQLAFSLYGPKSDVIALNKKNFADLVFGTEHIWVVEFFAPWCGHCKQLAPEYDKAATSLKGIVRIGAVDCDVEKELCGNFDVKGFPTLKFFPSKATPVQGKKDAFQKVPEDYQGARNAASIVSYALGKLPSFVAPVTSSNHEKFIGQPTPKAILFTNKDKTSDLYKALSIDLHNRLLLGEVKHTDKKLVEKYKVTSFPTLLVLGKEEGAEPTSFEGKLSHEALTKFLEPHAIPKPEKPSSSSSSSSSKSNPTVTGEIYEIKNQSVFDSKCVAKGGLCALAFLDQVNSEEAELEKYVAILTALGQKFKGKLHVLYTDALSQPELTKALDLSANYPNAVILNPNKLRYTPFLGAFTEESLSSFFDAVLRGKPSFPLDKLPSISTVTPPPPRPAKEEEEDVEVGKEETPEVKKTPQEEVKKTPQEEVKKIPKETTHKDEI